MAKIDTARQIIRIESPEADEEQHEFLAEALAKGFKAHELDERLRRHMEPEGPSEATEAVVALRGVDADTEATQAPAVIPSENRWRQIVAISEYVNKSALVPDALRGKPRDVALVMLKANDLGIPLTMALDQLYVIHGRVGMESKLMRALVRRDGHSIQDDPASDKRCAIVHGKRADNGDRGTGTFDLDDAVDFGLIKEWNEKEGRLTVTPVDGKPQYVKDTANMLKQRATARLCRDLFSDCLAGVTYTPEELGYVDAEEVGTSSQQEEATITVDQQRSAIARRIADLPDAMRSALRDEWKRRKFPKVDVLRAGAQIRQALLMLEEAEALAADAEREADKDIAEAEVVGEETAQGGEGPGPREGQAGDGVGTPSPALTDAASPSPPGAPTACAGCSEPFTAEAPPLYDDDGVAYHPSCMPF